MRWWTSDLHYGHGNIITFCDRPFTQPPAWAEGVEPETRLLVPDVDKMNAALTEYWNDTVADDDEIWVVGDLALGRIQTTVPMAKALRGNKFLVPGNHDGCHRMYPKWKRFAPLYEDAGFTILGSQETVQIAGQDVLVCHFPYTGDSKFDDRFSGLRPTDEGGWLIHGHTHSEQKRRDRQIHVGVDAWDFRPVSEDVIARIIEENSENLPTQEEATGPGPR